MPPIDVTGATGQKPARTARSQTARFAQPEARVESRDFARTTLVRQPSGTDSGLLAGVLSEFFAGQVSEQQDRDDKRIAEENRQEIMKIEAAVHADRAGARHAMLTGDTTGFVTPSLANRRAVLETFESMTAQTMADDDFNSSVKEGIAGLDINQDPQQYVEGVVSANTKGGSSIFKRDYARALVKRSAKAVADFRKQRVKVIQKRAEEGAVAAFISDVESGAIPMDPAGLAASLTKMVGTLPDTGPAAVLNIEVQRDQALAKIAAEKGGNALTFMNMKQPNVYDKDGNKISGRDGTSIRDRNPGLYNKALQSSKARYSQDRSLAQKAAIDTLDNELEAFKQTGEGDITAMYAKLQQLGTDFSKSNSWKALNRKFTTAMAGMASARAIQVTAAKGNSPGVGDTAWAAVASSFRDPATWANIAKDQGLPVEVVRSRLMRELGVRGPGKARKEAQSHMLLTSDDARQVQSLFEESEFYLSVRDVRMDDKKTGHYSREAFALLQYMHFVKASGGDPMGARQDFREALKAAGGKLDFKNHYKNIQDDEGKAIGPNAVAGAAKATWVLMGLPGAEDFDETSPTVRDALNDAVNMSSAMLSSKGEVSEEKVAALASQILKNNFGFELLDGKARYALDMTPALVMGPKGNMIRGTRMTERTVERIKRDMDLPENQALAKIMGGTLSHTQDTRTSAGHGLGVASTVRGYEEPIRFAAGKRFGVDFEDLPKDFPPALMQMIQTDVEGGVMTFISPPPPQGGEPIRRDLSRNLFLLYERSTGEWLLRWKDGGVLSTNPAEVSAANKARRAEMQSARPPSTHVNYKSTIAQIAPLPADESGQEGGLGSPVPTEDDHQNPVDPQEIEESDKVMDKIIAGLRKRGTVNPLAVSDEQASFLNSDEGAGMEERLNNVIAHEKANGGHLDDIETKPDETFRSRTLAFIENEEGFKSVQYDDHSNSGAMWRSSSTGNPTIGFGYNLNRPSARKDLAAVGLDFDKVMQRKQSITRSQATRLQEIAVAEVNSFLRTRFQGTDLENHQLQALISLAYNSRWNKDGPTLIGPKLTAAIKRGDWVAAGFEIAQNSENVPDIVRRGIHARRIKEATLFLGPELAASVDYLN